MNVLSLCGQEVGLTKNPSVSLKCCISVCSTQKWPKEHLYVYISFKAFPVISEAPCSFSGDFLIMWRLGHDGGPGERRLIRGGWNQRGHARWHRQWAAVQGFPRLWLPGCGAGGRRGDISVALRLFGFKVNKVSVSFLPVLIVSFVFVVLYIADIFLSLLVSLSNSVSFSFPPPRCPGAPGKVSQTKHLLSSAFLGAVVLRAHPYFILELKHNDWASFCSHSMVDSVAIRQVLVGYVLILSAFPSNFHATINSFIFVPCTCTCSGYLLPLCISYRARA